jgi:hypothetical protein
MKKNFAFIKIIFLFSVRNNKDFEILIQSQVQEFDIKSCSPFFKTHSQLKSTGFQSQFDRRKKFTVE